MKYTTSLLSIYFSFLSFYLIGQSSQLKSSIDVDDAHHPVRQLYLSSIEAFNDGNLDLFLSNFSEDIKMYGTDGVYSGKEALSIRFQKIFQQFPNTQMEIPDLELEVLSEDIVLVNFKWKVFPMGVGPAFSGQGSGLYVFRDNRWIEILEAESVTDVDDALQQK